MGSKTFVLCIGEPKSGTSWVYSYLAEDKNFANSGNKEWNIWSEYFNILDIPEFLPNGQKNLRYTAEDRLGRGCPIARHQKNNKARASANRLRYCMIKIDRFYENFFKLLLIESNKTVTGDFSPEYKLLNAEQLEYIKKRLERAGFTVKVVYLIRDPIERSWSAYKFTKKINEGLKKSFPNVGKTKNAQGSFGETPSVAEFFVKTKEFFQHAGSKKSGWFMYNSYYQETIENIEKVFEPQNTFVEAYETFFTKEKIKEFSDFCGVDYNEEMISNLINANPHNDELPPGAKKRMYKLLTTNNKVGEKYKKCYEYCLQRFPKATKQWLKDTV